ncbi:MAG TPA: hypothetical protein VNK70_02585 [Candidatus Paceibacterota bacterium]|nr:hypothetical protein [Candidatus Paceibacterota bacterium]
MLKKLKNDARYSWTAHSFMKMQYYGISEGRVKRIIRFPKRTEEGIVPDTVAVMQPAGTKRYQEIWVMYKLAKRANSKPQVPNPKQKTIKVITAWRYPGKSPERNPVPKEIIEEVRALL